MLGIFRALAMAGLVLTGLPASADSTADCGRFFLKYEPKTGRMECVGRQFEKRRAEQDAQFGTLTRALTQAVRLQQSTVDEAESLLRSRNLSEATKRRARELLSDAEQRTREIRQLSAELIQEQRRREQDLASSQGQLAQAQIQLAQELEQKQQALTQQLVSETRARTQARFSK